MARSEGLFPVDSYFRACVIIGGRGFLGKSLARRLLLASGKDAWDEVRVMDIQPELVLSDSEMADEVITAALKNGRLVYVSADVCKREDVARACRGVSVVFHMASLSPELKEFIPHYKVTVLGAKNVVAACLAEEVRELIYTSSASVVFDGSCDLKGINETWPYCRKHMSVYGETKAQAEAIVLAANGKNGILRTVAVRPANIFGPGDTLLVPAVAKNAAAGKLKFIIGDGQTQNDWTFVENVVAGHICAENALRTEEAQGTWDVSGKAYFITNDEPWEIWTFLFGLAESLGYHINPVAKLPAAVVLPLSHIAESVTSALKPLGVKPSDFTPFRMKILTRWRVFSCNQAKDLLGYKPECDVKEGIRRTAEGFPHLRKEVLLPS